jgi:hypothetical protein
MGTSKKGLASKVERSIVYAILRALTNDLADCIRYQYKEITHVGEGLTYRARDCYVMWHWPSKLFEEAGPVDECV